jgi:hypothetical protein
MYKNYIKNLSALLVNEAPDSLNFSINSDVTCQYLNYMRKPRERLRNKMIVPFSAAPINLKRWQKDKHTKKEWKKLVECNIVVGPTFKAG